MLIKHPEDQALFAAAPIDEQAGLIAEMDFGWQKVASPRNKLEFANQLMRVTAILKEITDHDITDPKVQSEIVRGVRREAERSRES